MICMDKAEETMLVEIIRLIQLGVAMTKVEILVAVEPAPLLRVIEHLFQRQSEYRIVARRRGGSALARQASHLRPELIIANMRLLGPGAAKIIPEVKHASPRSKLIVTGFPQGFGTHARKLGADAYLDEEHLVRRLVPTAQKLLGKQQLHPKKGAARIPRHTSTSTYTAPTTSPISARPGKGHHLC